MLAVLVLAVGVPLARLVPIDVLRVVIGALLLVLGLDWLRKAVLRASGHKALHARTRSCQDGGGSLSGGGKPKPCGQLVEKRASRRHRVHGRFKGVFLEGMEVVLIVITLGRELGSSSAGGDRGRRRCR